MPYEVMKELAERIASGGTFKKSEVVAFMKEFLGLEAMATPAALAPKTDVETDGRDLPTLYFEIEKTDTGIHVPREANRSYDTREGYALVAKLVEALKK